MIKGNFDSRRILTHLGKYRQRMALSYVSSYCHFLTQHKDHVFVMHFKFNRINYRTLARTFIRRSAIYIAKFCFSCVCKGYHSGTCVKSHKLCTPRVPWLCQCYGRWFGRDEDFCKHRNHVPSRSNNEK